MKTVTEEEFQAFLTDYIAKHPGRLMKDITQMVEPPIQQYNDFSIGKWPESIVCQVHLSDPFVFEINELLESHHGN